MLKRFNKLENERQQQVLVMLEASANLSRSHWYKEKFLEILDCNDRETAKEKIEECYISGDCRPLKELKEILSKIEKR